MFASQHQQYSEEGPGLSATPTQIPKEETQDKLIDVQKVNPGATQTVQQGESLRQSLLLDNVLVDSKGHIKISNFGFSALPQQYREDGLLHTMCGSPNYNYVSPEILSNRGYDGGALDTWSCGVIFYVILTGYLPFDDRNLGVLYQKHITLANPGNKGKLQEVLEAQERYEEEQNGFIEEQAQMKKDMELMMKEIKCSSQLQS
ncbi:CBL-interacting serine/threonine-protein kinase 1-like protein [Tanacetum coccineum]